MNLLLKIKELKKEMSKTEKRIANFVLKNVEDIKDMTTYEISQKCSTSQASIVRFSKKLGFKGFPEFKIALVEEIFSNINVTDNFIAGEEISRNDNIESVSRKITNKNLQAIKDTEALMDYNELEKAINMIQNADKIMIVGYGFSGIVAKDFSYKLSEIGFNAYFEAGPHIQFAYLPTMKKNDVVFVISYSGRTKEAVQFTKIAKKLGLFVISLTTLAPNPIRDLADIKLNSVGIPENSNYRITPLSPRISQLNVIDSIYVNLILKDKKRENYILNAIDITKDFKL